ncbi:MAG: hypothetical protein JWN07_1741 [Hyphomicrobiales bacterium]|nr:hypothetical protein [Hyphomicrobiales bacterium]
MDEAELREIAEKAAGLDRLVPKIAAGLREAVAADDFQRLTDLLKLAERFMIEAGPLMSRIKPDEPALRETVERFMREMPRRLRMIRDAQAILPPLSADNHFARTG